jgi:hypothetical protein
MGDDVKPAVCIPTLGSSFMRIIPDIYTPLADHLYMRMCMRILRSYIDTISSHKLHAPPYCSLMNFARQPARWTTQQGSGAHSTNEEDHCPHDCCTNSNNSYAAAVNRTSQMSTLHYSHFGAYALTLDQQMGWMSMR